MTASHRDAFASYKDDSPNYRMTLQATGTTLPAADDSASCRNDFASYMDDCQLQE
jgi:hypothetical protein